MTHNEYRDLYTRWLLARRDTPGIDVGPPPKYVTRDLNSHRDCEVGKRLRHECDREFARSLESGGYCVAMRDAGETLDKIIADIAAILNKPNAEIMKQVKQPLFMKWDKHKNIGGDGYYLAGHGRYHSPIDHVRAWFWYLKSCLIGDMWWKQLIPNCLSVSKWMIQGDWQSAKARRKNKMFVRGNFMP